MIGILAAGSFLAGLILHDASLGLTGALIPIGVVICFCLYKTSWSNVATSVICLMCLALGYGRASTSKVVQSQAVPASLHQFSGVILGVPRMTGSGVRAEIGIAQPRGLVVSAFLPSYPSTKQGDVVRFRGDVAPPVESSGAGSTPVTVFARDVEIIGSRARPWQRVRNTIHDNVNTWLSSSVPLPAGALATGVLIGDDRALTLPERAQFRAAGLSHITAVSGWNIALVTGLLMFLHRYIPLPLTPRIALGILGIWAYTYLTGSEPSAVRAAIMGTICLIAIWRGRPRDALTILLFAIAAMLTIQPLTRFSLGFQLSVFATLGLVLTMPLLARAPSWTALILVPAIAELSVAPVLLHQLGQYSLVSPLANLIVEPLVVPLAATAAITALASAISPTLGPIIGILPWLFGKVMMGVAAFASSIPGTSGLAPYLSWDWMVAVYAIMASAVFGADWWMHRLDQATESETNLDDGIMP